MTLKKERLVKQIAKDLFLREDVVEEVIDRFIDISVAEIANTGEFRLHQFFNVSSVKYKGFVAGKGVVPDHFRLKVKLSSGLNTLFKLKSRGEIDLVTPDNWREILKEQSEAKRAKYDQDYDEGYMNREGGV
ncbi:hypothetical protein E6Q11_06510 [Candidatus Dojkabacteria bacterium]|uniref:Uncharacterized protein n=1 Tax=Candidatus Dojkabacteria bacterium TaxID=2099670 RepID=A0A5C7J4J9_9BACT|nr:MAG: hypothetical protein E6Q11_06510 [Candidatus Dojkabacteria bacterium]